MKEIINILLPEFLLRMFSRINEGLFHRFRDLSATVLHLRLLILSILVTFPFVLGFLTSLDWEISYICSPLLMLLALPWIPYGQIMAVIFRLRRQVDPSTGEMDSIAEVFYAGLDEIRNAISKPYLRLAKRHGKRQIDQILVLTGGLVFLSLICLWVFYIIRTEI
jgi:hypothetical protein